MNQNLEQTSGDIDQLLIFGFGYSAKAIAANAHGQFTRIVTTNRSIPDETPGQLHRLVFDGKSTSEDLLQAVRNSNFLLISIGPGDEGDPVLNTFKETLLEHDNLKWIGYLSTVGVYGNHDGEWVDEETICKPVSKRSVARIGAEQQWTQLAQQLSIPLSIFRLSGIYGPGRNAMVNMDKGKSRRLVKKGQVFNRIHRDDIAQAANRAMQIRAEGIFNITDDEPAPPQDVVTYVHQLRGVEPPPEIDFDKADLTPMARSFYGENKRVSNHKSKQVLGMKYRWPNYRAAFDAMWADKSWI